SNPNLSAMALQRAHHLQTGAQNYGASVGAMAPPPAYPTTTPVSTQPIQIGGPKPSGAPARTTAGSSAVSPPRGYVSRNGQTSWLSFRGVLRRAGRTIEGQTTYA